MPAPSDRIPPPRREQPATDDLRAAAVVVFSGAVATVIRSGQWLGQLAKGRPAG